MARVLRGIDGSRSIRHRTSRDPDWVVPIRRRHLGPTEGLDDGRAGGRQSNVLGRRPARPAGRFVDGPLGLACLDWPRCYGTWVPFLQPSLIASSPYTPIQIFVEWAHRGLALLVGVLMLGTGIAAWRTQRHRPLVRWSATLAIVLLPVQIVLGGLTVTRSLQPFIVTSHLGVALLILLSLATTTVAAWLDTTDGLSR